jgi:hypothetical protein
MIQLAQRLENVYNMDFLAVAEEKRRELVQALESGELARCLRRQVGAGVYAIRIACMASGLHRGKGPKVEGLEKGQSFEIGVDIPLCRVVTAELESSEWFADLYADFLFKCAGRREAARSRVAFKSRLGETRQRHHLRKATSNSRPRSIVGCVLPHSIPGRIR